MAPSHTLNKQNLVEIYRNVMAIGKDLDLPEMRMIDFEQARGEYVLSPLGNEQFLCFRDDAYISKGLFQSGNTEIDKFDKAVNLLGRRFETLIDIGANIGTICIAALKRDYVQRAIAIEPEPRNFRTLMANAYLNDVHASLFGINKAAGQFDDQVVEFEISPNNMGDHRVKVAHSDGSYGEGSRNQIQVVSTTLDTALSSVHQLSLDNAVVCLDTQGYEGFVMAGAQGLVAAKVPCVVEFWPYGMLRTGSYGLLRQNLTAYSHFFDLNEPNPQRQDANEVNLDRLFNSLSGGIEFTDILVF